MSDPRQDVLRSALPGYVELFDIDLSTTNITALVNTTLHLTANVNPDGSFITFGNSAGVPIQYTPCAISIADTGESSTDAPPRPQLSVSNIDKTIGAMLFRYDDIVGATVTYWKTFAPYVNSTSRLSCPPTIMRINAKLAHTHTSIVFSLWDRLDNDRLLIPRRQMLSNEFPGLSVNNKVTR